MDINDVCSLCALQTINKDIYIVITRWIPAPADQFKNSVLNPVHFYLPQRICNVPTFSVQKFKKIIPANFPLRIPNSNYFLRTLTPTKNGLLEQVPDPQAQPKCDMITPHPFPLLKNLSSPKSVRRFSTYKRTTTSNLKIWSLLYIYRSCKKPLSWNIGKFTTYG